MVNFVTLSALEFTVTVDDATIDTGIEDNVALSVAITDVNERPRRDVTINGMTAEDNTLTAIPLLEDDEGLGPFTVQWLRGDNVIVDATEHTFDLDQVDVGSTVRAIACYTDTQVVAEARTGAPTTPVTNVNDEPSETVTISGTPAQGQSLTATSTLMDDDGLGVLAYQWLRNETPIEGATDTRYELQVGDARSEIAARVSYTDLQDTDESWDSAGLRVSLDLTIAGTSAAETDDGGPENDSLNG